jgi:NADPH:quinone reductase-like Zn-dependent oxidoreductase
MWRQARAEETSAGPQSPGGGRPGESLRDVGTSASTQRARLLSNAAQPAPDDIADEQLASFMINPASAILMVRHILKVPRGEWLLQSKAGSELGRMIIRLAQTDGFRTTNVVRRHAQPRK